MSGFKGTKGKWVFDDEDVFSVTKDESEIIEFVARNTKPYQEGTNWKSNATLISKAPEMLEMLEMLSASIHFLNSNNIHVTKDKIDKLIKSATEL